MFQTRVPHLPPFSPTSVARGRETLAKLFLADVSWRGHRWYSIKPDTASVDQGSTETRMIYHLEFNQALVQKVLCRISEGAEEKTAVAMKWLKIHPDDIKHHFMDMPALPHYRVQAQALHLVHPRHLFNSPLNLLLKKSSLISPGQTMAPALGKVLFSNGCKSQRGKQTISPGPCTPNTLPPQSSQFPCPHSPLNV